MLKQKPLARSIRALFMGGLALNLSLAYSQDTDDTASMQRVEITGSLIKRVAGEGPAPVEIVTRKDIERTGATTLNELIRSIPVIDIFDQGEQASNSPSGSGTSNIRMRGLDESNVLVLLNGRRLPVNALYDSTGAGAAVDINMIPITAIERVEVLKEGGSALYGADAVAGVVNFITKKDYQGFDASATYGISSRGDGQEKSASLTAGFGNLDNDNFNVLLTVNMFKRDPILRKDRDISRSADFRRFGGRDNRSGFSPYGNYLDPDTFDFTGDTKKPCPPENYNSYCRYDFNADLLTAYNGADRLGSMALGSLKLSRDVRAFAELSYSTAKDHFESHPVPDYFAVDSGTGWIAGRFMQGGPRLTDRKSSTDGITAGVEGTTNKIDWSVALGQGRNRVTNQDSNYFNADLWTPATEQGLIDPTVTTNDPAFVESLKVRPYRSGESKLQHLDGKVSGELLQMSNGPLAYAVGVSLWRESLLDEPDELQQQGLVVGSIAQAKVDAARVARALFAELDIPVTKALEAQAAVRYDDYKTDSSVSPRIAGRYEVSPSLMFRASYARSFRMPALKQLYGAQEQGAININNESGAANCEALGLPSTCDVAAWQVNGSNPTLKPEKGATWNLGTAFDASKYLAGTVDFWRITKEDEITTPTVDDAIKSGMFGRDPDSRWVVYTNLANQAQRVISGVDLDLRTRLPRTAYGTFGLRNTTTYYFNDKRKETPQSEWKILKDSYATPKIRNMMTATYEQESWSGALGWRYTGSFLDAVDPTPTTRRVSSYSEIDLTTSYAGFKNFHVNFGIKNLFDKQPPFSVQNASDNAYTQMGFAELYTSRGRFYYVGLNYSFK